MSDQSHSSKFQDVLARMKAAKTASDDTSQTESSSMRVSADSITASTIQKPRDIGVKPVQFSSIKKETIAPILDETADMEAAILKEQQKQAARVSRLQSQIDSLLGTDEATVARIRRKGQQVINQILADNTGKSLDQVEIDTERDNYMTAEEARDYGLIDEIISNRK